MRVALLKLLAADYWPIIEAGVGFRLDMSVAALICFAVFSTLVYNLLNVECTYLKSKIEHYYMVTLSIEEDKKKENPIDKKSVEEAEEIVNYFKSELTTMEEELFKDGGSFDTWDKDMELYAILKIYLTYGVLRPSEIVGMQITGTDEGNDKVNYINVATKKIVINDHKNDKKGKKIIDITDDKLNEVLFGGFQFHECQVVHRLVKCSKADSTITTLMTCGNA
jgi:hypothetical protein